MTKWRMFIYDSSVVLLWKGGRWRGKIYQKLAGWLASLATQQQVTKKEILPPTKWNTITYIQPSLFSPLQICAHTYMHKHKQTPTNTNKKHALSSTTWIVMKSQTFVYLVLIHFPFLTTVVLITETKSSYEK